MERDLNKFYDKCNGRGINIEDFRHIYKETKELDKMYGDGKDSFFPLAINENGKLLAFIRLPEYILSDPERYPQVWVKFSELETFVNNY